MNSVKYFLGAKLCGKVARRLRRWAARLDGGEAVMGNPLQVVKTVCGVPCKLEILRASERLHRSDTHSFYGAAMIQASKDQMAVELARHVQGCVHFTEWEAGNEYRIEAELFTYKPVQQ